MNGQYKLLVTSVLINRDLICPKECSIISQLSYDNVVGEMICNEVNCISTFHRTDSVTLLVRNVTHLLRKNVNRKCEDQFDVQCINNTI